MPLWSSYLTSCGHLSIALPACRNLKVLRVLTAEYIGIELAEKFPGRTPNDDLLRNFLSRKGFAPGALSAVVLAYRETSEMVSGIGSPYVAVEPATEETLPMVPQSTTPNLPGRVNAPPHQPAEPTVKERSLGRYDFEGGQYVRMAASEGLDTEDALEMLMELIDMKRRELQRQSRLGNRPSLSLNPDPENAGDDQT